MSYHAKIMNLRCVGWNDLYKEGHRDARHAAAEIVIVAEQEIEQLREALEAAYEYMAFNVTECSEPFPLEKYEPPSTGRGPSEAARCGSCDPCRGDLVRRNTISD